MSMHDDIKKGVEKSAFWGSMVGVGVSELLLEILKNMKNQNPLVANIGERMLYKVDMNKKKTLYKQLRKELKAKGLIKSKNKKQVPKKEEIIEAEYEEIKK